MKILSWIVLIGLVGLCVYEIVGLVRKVIFTRKARKNKKTEGTDNVGNCNSSNDN